jgi:hypothetical protein
MSTGMMLQVCGSFYSLPIELQTMNAIKRHNNDFQSRDVPKTARNNLLPDGHYFVSRNHCVCSQLLHGIPLHMGREAGAFDKGQASPLHHLPIKVFQHHSIKVPRKPPIVMFKDSFITCGRPGYCQLSFSITKSFFSTSAPAHSS